MQAVSSDKKEIWVLGEGGGDAKPFVRRCCHEGVEVMALVKDGRQFDSIGSRGEHEYWEEQRFIT